MTKTEKPDFETWTKAEISRLRAEADNLERALRAYRGAAPDLLAPAQHVANGQDDADDSSRFAVIMRAIEHSPKGLTVDECMALAEKIGKPVKRNVIRSQLWTRKKNGGLIQRGKRYLVKAKGPDAPTPGPSH